MQQHPELASLASIFHDRFPPLRAQRGLQLFRRGATQVMLAQFEPVDLLGMTTDDDIWRDAHNTSVRVHGADLDVQCTCAEARLCEHAYALLLAVDAMHNDAAPQPHALAVAERDEPEDWESRLEMIADEVDAEDDPAPIARDGELVNPIVWTIDLEKTVSHGKLTLLAMEPIMHEGQTALRSRLPGVTEPPVRALDWRILHLLSLPNAATSRSKGRYQVSDGFLPLLLPMLGDGAEVILVEAVGGERPPVPLQFDLEPPFRLVTEQRQTGGSTEVHGVLCRGEHETLDAPVLAMFGGYAIAGTRLVRLDLGRGRALGHALLREGPLRARAQHAPQLLARVMEIASADPSIAPPLPTRQVTPDALVLIVHFGRRLAGKILVDLAFDYEGRIAAFDGDTRLLAPIDDGEWLRRDEAAEGRLVDDFEERFGDRFDTDLFDSCLLLAPARALATLSHVVAAGVRVLVDGKPMLRTTAQSVAVHSGIDWFDVQGELQFEGGGSVPLAAAMLAARRGDKLVELGDGRTGLLPEDLLQRWGPLFALGEIEDGALRLPRGQALLLEALLSAREGERIKTDAGFDAMRDKLAQFAGLSPRQEPPGFVGTLRDYQRDGLAWLHFLRETGLGGCLADDMGLGKTVQVLALLLEVHRQRPGRPSLLVAPRSLIDNWQREAARFAPDLRVLDFAQPDRWQHGKAAILAHDLVLTTYAMMRSDIERFEQDELQFEYVVVDEAQAIENAASLTSKAARLLRAQHRLALTGTPVQNHIGELWALFEFLTPGLLGKSSVFKRLVSSGKGRGDAAEQQLDTTLLRRALAPFLLRRTKEQVLRELPPKQEQTIHCELPPGQRKAYDALREHYRGALLHGGETLGNKEQFMVLEALLRLRQAACHPSLVDKVTKPRPSAKLDTLLPMLLEIAASGHKALVFSQFTEFLAIVKKQLIAHDITHEYLDGQTRKRQAAVDRFQSDPACSAFLISLKAGGFGLNLTAADYVFLLDPWWNPAAENQAIDRAHRMGQTNTVVAYRLVARDTVEEKVLQLQDEKRKLFDAVLGGDGSLLAGMTREDLAMILS